MSGTPADILSEVVPLLAGAGQMARHSPVRGRATGLTGRRSERDVLDRLIDAVRAGEGRALVVTGELTRALELVLALDAGTDEADRWLWLTGGRAGAIIALELWDADSRPRSWPSPGAISNTTGSSARQGCPIRTCSTPW